MAIEYTKDARRGLKKLQRSRPKQAKAMVDALHKIEEDPEQAGLDITLLKGELAGFRLRIGSWRATFSFEGKTLVVTNIAARGSVY